MNAGTPESGPVLAPSQWQLAKQVFDDALALDEAGRAGFLDAAATDPAVRLEVERLLAAWRQAEPWFLHAGQEVLEFAATPALEPGDVLGGRYRIERFIARGGMGEVYEADDQVLSGRVALKMIRPALAFDPALAERFRREIQLSRVIKSPYVCRVHDIEYHQDPLGGETTFYTMELLAGATLAAHLARHGPLPLAEARPLIRAMALGLDAAHRLGVLHRDFKPGNVILTPHGAVITDFGLAHDLAGSVESLPGATAAYAAPEQILRQSQSVATDIYSFGVVLHEMLTGLLPREPLSAKIPRIVRQCLATDPAERPRSALGVAQSLGALEKPLWTTRRALMALPAAAVAGVLGTRLVMQRRPAPAVRMLAVLPFAYSDHSLAYLADGLSDRLRDFLGRVPGLRVAARFSSVKAAKSEAKTIAQIGDLLGATEVLNGHLRRTATGIKVGFEVLDSASSAQLVANTYDSTEAAVSGLYADILRNVVHRLAPSASALENPSLSPHAEANQQYLLGRFYVDRRDKESVRLGVACLERAVSLAPTFSDAYSALGWAWYHFIPRSGLPRPYGIERARSAALRALELQDRHPEAHLVLGSLDYLYLCQWPRSETYLRRAVQLDPNLAAAHQVLANLLNALGRTSEALPEIDLAIRLDPLNPSFSNTRGNSFAYSGQTLLAIDQYLSVQKKDPGFIGVYGLLPLSLAQAGRTEEAISYARQGVAQSKRASFMLGVLAYSLALHGDTQSARSLLVELESRLGDPHTDPSILAQVAVALQNYEYALDLLERGRAEYDSGMTTLLSPAFGPLRTHPRFGKIARDLGLPLERLN